MKNTLFDKISFLMLVHVRNVLVVSLLCFGASIAKEENIHVLSAAGYERKTIDSKSSSGKLNIGARFETLFKKANIEYMYYGDAGEGISTFGVNSISVIRKLRS